ncbi:MAG: hypothetical protein ACKVT1_10265 [Dehalococcoidia bacterium]
MRIIRFFTGDDNETHFEELEIPLDAGEFVNRSGRIPVEDVMFLDNNAAPGQPGTFHNAPQRQFVVMLSGVHEVTAASGESRRWGPGEIFLPDDTTGHGHLTAVIEPPVRYLFIKLPDDFDASQYRVW